MADSKFIDAGAGWKKTNRNGDAYISISVKADLDVNLSDCFLSLTKNTKKGANPKAPDYKLTAVLKDGAQKKAPPKQEESDDFGF